MSRLSFARGAGIGVLVAILAAPGLVGASGQAADGQVAEKIATIFAGVPESDAMSLVIKDNRNRVYLVFYVATFADVKEMRAWSITFRNTNEYPEDIANVDAMIEAGNFAEAQSTLIDIIRLDLGSQYVSDVGLDGVHEGAVAVGQGQMTDRYHRQQFESFEEANEAYVGWLDRAIALLSGG
jgi:hypothetical protein